MKSLLSDVASFHRACGVPVLVSPQIPPRKRIDLRIELIREEVDRELIPAMRTGILSEIADAMADSIYVIVGAALEYGIPLDQVWREVQHANMSKVDPKTGVVRRRFDGKILKPDGWVAPDIAAILAPVSVIRYLAYANSSVSVYAERKWLDYRKEQLNENHSTAVREIQRQIDDGTLIVVREEAA